MPADPAPLTVDVRLDPATWHAHLAEGTRDGLTSVPKHTPPVWFYDDLGSKLFDEITRLPEYYPTRAERAVLAACADEVAERTGADTLVELGSGTSEKTRLLLDALAARGTLGCFAPLDVSEGTLRRAAAAVAAEHSDVAVHAVVGDFLAHLDAIPGAATAGGRRLVAFLGGTVGNLDPPARADFLRRLAEVLAPGDGVLLGTDLIKDRSRLVAAYDDAAGVTAAFNRNSLEVMNRELGADFDAEAFDHAACFDEANGWIEMRLVARRPQRVRVRGLDDLVVDFATGEHLRTEISTKFTEPQVRAELAAAGLPVEATWTDPDGDFLVTLARPAA